ncbi:MAG: hypothetical protein M3N12_07590, partial [Verrucomicrobiota bacterium]|nr:hypothetical protein [Verrucomicrobiota bacterium]
SVDPNFPTNPDNFVRVVALQPNGDILAAGDFATVGGVSRANAVRIIGDPLPPQLLNISTRMAVETGDNALIGGFIVTGLTPKRVMVRAIGPSLNAFGVPGALADPVLELHDSQTTIATNDNWRKTQLGGVIAGDQRLEIIASGIAPRTDPESALIARLMPGPYTALVKGVAGTTGVGLIEVYDLEGAAPSQLANISSRGHVETESNVMIGGFIIGGNGNAKVLVRAIGPSLTTAGVAGALGDPTLELHDGSGTIIATNDNWKINDMTGQSQESVIRATTVPPSNDLESALVATLSPGNYTAIVRGKNNTTGVGLVEVYNLQ